MFLHKKKKSNFVDLMHNDFELNILAISKARVPPKKYATLPYDLCLILTQSNRKTL